MEEITGRVRNLRIQNENNRSVWTFTLERVDDQGSPLSPVPVQMEGIRFEGFVNEGDLVSIKGSWKSGSIIKPKEAHNLTTNSHVKAKTYRWVYVIFIIVFIVFVLFIISGFLQSLGSFILPANQFSSCVNGIVGMVFRGC